MPNRHYDFLTETQVAHFVDRGFVIIQDCFSSTVASSWREQAFTRLGCDERLPETWTEDRVRLPAVHEVVVRDFAPRAWGAICDLLGGEEHVAARPIVWRDGFHINIRYGADGPWIPPGPSAIGWHKQDGDYHHLLGGPRLGLSVIVVCSEIEHRGGGTFISPDSVVQVARLLAQHPEGLPPGYKFGDLIHECKEFVELTGHVGDVVLCHPHMLLAESGNHSCVPAVTLDAPVSLQAPMDLHREMVSEYSPTEQAILNALDVEHFSS